METAVHALSALLMTVLPTASSFSREGVLGCFGVASVAIVVALRPAAASGGH
jgi:hypothetical protein